MGNELINWLEVLAYKCVWYRNVEQKNDNEEKCIETFPLNVPYRWIHFHMLHISQLIRNFGLLKFGA